MPFLIVAFAASGSFTQYPGFLNPKARIEAILDRGTISELIVKCGDGAGIISYSKVERLYCTPHQGCTPNFKTALARMCD